MKVRLEERRKEKRPKANKRIGVNKTKARHCLAFVLFNKPIFSYSDI